MQKKKPNFRSNRLSSEIKQVLSNYLLCGNFIEHEADIDPKKILIKDVVVSPDLRYAKIFISYMDDKISLSQCVAFLEGYHGQIRHCIAEEIPLRYVPDFAFHEDHSEEYAHNIENLLKVASERISNTN